MGDSANNEVKPAMGELDAKLLAEQCKRLSEQVKALQLARVADAMWRESGTGYGRERTALDATLKFITGACMATVGIAAAVGCVRWLWEMSQP